MKKQILTLLLLTIIYLSYGQSNTSWSTSNSIGIGTTQPNSIFHVDNGDLTLGHNQSITLIKTQYFGGALRFKSSSDSWDRYLQLGNVDNNGTFYPSLSVQTDGSFIIGRQTTHDETILKTKYFGGAIKFKSSNDSWDRYLQLGYVDNNDTYYPTFSVQTDGNFIIGKQTTHDETLFKTKYAGGAIKFKSSIDSWDRYLQLGNVDNNGVFSPRMTIGTDGKIGIGVSVNEMPGDSKLYVAGRIMTEEVKVMLKSNWADFVFDKNYNLISLYDLEYYIAENNHLPNIPSANKVEKEGINIGEMNSKLLQKIEELTLYTIEQEKKIDKLEKQINELMNLVK